MAQSGGTADGMTVSPATRSAMNSMHLQAGGLGLARNHRLNFRYAEPNPLSAVDCWAIFNANLGSPEAAKHLGPCFRLNPGSKSDQPRDAQQP